MTESKDPKEMAQAVKRSADNAYWLWDEMCPADATTIAIATLRELNKQFDDWGGDEPSCCVFREIVDIIKELEAHYV